MKRETVLITIAAMLTFSLLGPLYAAAGRPEWEGLVLGSEAQNHTVKTKKTRRAQKARQDS